MEISESPLDVLSRAATMVQGGLPLNTDDSTHTSTKQLPTTKWKRERRTSRLPEYSRKSDPKLPENLPPELLSNVHCSSPISSNNSSSSESSTGSSPTHSINNGCNKNGNGFVKKGSAIKDTLPLDMSVKPRGSPPSYSQAINSTYRSGYRPSVITSTPPNSNDGFNGKQNVTSSKNVESNKSISMCDPIIDEHFRRSLGKDYAMLFASSNPESNKTPSIIKKVTENSTSPVTNHQKTKKSNLDDKNGVIQSFREMMDTDSASLSVDDHFAKALGDTWIQLNKKEKIDGTKNGGTSNENGKPVRISL